MKVEESKSACMMNLSGTTFFEGEEVKSGKRGKGEWKIYEGCVGGRRIGEKVK